LFFNFGRIGFLSGIFHRKLERLHRSLFSSSCRRAATLGGCRLVVEGNAVLVCREARNLPAPLSVAAGREIALHWDRRFDIRLAAPEKGDALVLTGLGEVGWDGIVRENPEFRRNSLPAPALSALPALLDGGGVLEVPHLGYFRPDGARPPAPILDARFRPPVALSGVGFALPIGPGVLSL